MLVVEDDLIQWVNIMPWLVHSPIPDRNLISSSRISHLHQNGIGWCTDEVIAPWPHMPNLIQLVQGTEQVLHSAMIRYMVVVLAR